MEQFIMTHSVTYCEKCSKIFRALMDEEAYTEKKAIRFNQLERLTGLATQTFYNHIQQLVKIKIVKEKRKGKENRSFFLDLSVNSQIISDEKAKDALKLASQHNEVYRTWTSNQIIAVLTDLSALLELQVTKIWLQNQLPNANEEKLQMEARIAGAFINIYRILLRDAMKNRSNQWLKEAIASLDGKIADLKKQLFG
jgi:hypothetical protein